MLDLYVHKKDWEPAYRNQKAPSVEPSQEGSIRLIDADTNEPIASQVNLDKVLLEDKYRLRKYLNDLEDWDDKLSNKPSNGSARQSGIRSESRVFGVTPPVPMRKRYGCGYSRFNSQYPEIYSLLTSVIERAENVLSEYMPEMFEKHRSLVGDLIHKDWRIGDSHFTSGNINNTAALPYHKDRGNIKGTVNIMVCVRSGVEGGSLHLPEWDLNLAIPDWSISTFDGQSYWHGVTPFTRTKKDSHRYTIVYYAKQAISGGVAYADEPARAAFRATNASTDYSQPNQKRTA